MPDGLPARQVTPAQSARAGSAPLPSMLSWTRWQRAVLALLRAEFTDHHIGFDEVDWLSWRLFYDAGKTPRAAIDRALERDF